jgi:ABC-2 type transport system ATP-binding protein
MTSAVVCLDRISKQYGARAVLREVSLEVAQGEIHGLMGANGSGKSTLLRIVAGGLRPTSGKVRTSGSTGYVAQKFSLYEDLSVDENLAFWVQCHGFSGVAARTRVADVMARLDLAQFRQHRAGDLSHGWKQRLALAAALCHGPSILLLDEATSGFDPEARQDLWHVLHACARRGTAILLATHQMDEADHCDRISYLREGALAEAPIAGTGALAGPRGGVPCGEK